MWWSSLKGDGAVCPTCGGNSEPRGQGGATRKSKQPRSGTCGGPQSGGTDQALMPSWTGAAWNVEPRELERVSWWWDSRSDELWTQLVVATVNQGDKVGVPQGSQSSQGVGHVVVP